MSRKQSDWVSFRVSNSCILITAYPGQIYVPFINRALFVGCILLVLTFGASSALAAPLALAVSGVTVITSLAMFPIARRYWNWGAATTGLRLGHAIRSQYFLVYRELAQVCRRRVGSAFGRRRSLPSDDDLAMGSQGDLRGVFGQVRDDDGGARNASSRMQSFHGAQRCCDGSEFRCGCRRSRPCNGADAMGATRHPAA